MKDELNLKPDTAAELEKREREVIRVFEQLVERSGAQAAKQPHDTINTLLKAKYIPELDQPVDVGLIGVPTDAGLTHRSGARAGPQALRAASPIRYVRMEDGAKPFDQCDVADIGNVAFDRVFQLENVVQDIYLHFAMLAERDITPLTVGGDHSITYPILKALAPSEPVALIHFDAHHDTVPPFGGSKYHHGAPFLLAGLEGHIDPTKTIQVAIRDPYVEMNRFAFESGMTIVTAEQWDRMGVDEVAARARDVVGDAPVYLSFDVDGLDPVFAPGTGSPVPSGPSVMEATRFLRGLAGLNFVGADLVEISPALEAGGDLTAINGAHLFFEMLCLLAPTRARA